MNNVLICSRQNTDQQCKVKCFQKEKEAEIAVLFLSNSICYLRSYYRVVLVRIIILVW